MKKLRLPKTFLHYPGRYLTAWALVIFVLCATPGDYIPSTNWLELLSFDKLVHAGIFFTLSSLWIIYHTVSNKSRALYYVGITLCVLYGASLEWMQAEFFRNRSADWKDIIANTTGCLIAMGTKNILTAKLQSSANAAK